MEHSRTDRVLSDWDMVSGQARRPALPGPSGPVVVRTVLPGSALATAAVLIVAIAAAGVWLALPRSSGIPVGATPTSPSPARPGTTPSTAPSPQPIAGGCGSTTLFSGPGPDAAHVRGLDQNPWVAATPASAGIRAYLWGTPPYLAAGSVRPGGQSNKILWLTDPPATEPFQIAARVASTDAPTVRFAFPSDSSPVGGYPSMIDLPSPGCWELDLSIGSRRGTMSLLVAAP